METIVDVFAEELGALEGPTVMSDGALIVTSVSAGLLYRIQNGRAELFAETGGGPNGATEGPNNCVFVAQNGGQHGGVIPAEHQVDADPGVQLIKPDGSITHFGAGMTAPNDLCFGPDGFLYVTDPTRKPERDDGRIWRCNVDTLECEQIFACDWYPNGIGFSTEDDHIYVADSRHRRIVRLPLADMRPESEETVVEFDHGIPDGFAFDVSGRLIVACPVMDGVGDVQVFKDGCLIEIIRPGDSRYYLNVAISPDAKLYICDATKGQVLVTEWSCPGLPLHPFRKMSGGEK